MTVEAESRPVALPPLYLLILLPRRRLVLSLSEKNVLTFQPFLLDITQHTESAMNEGLRPSSRFRRAF